MCKTLENDEIGISGVNNKSDKSVKNVQYENRGMHKTPKIYEQRDTSKPLNMGDEKYMVKNDKNISRGMDKTPNMCRDKEIPNIYKRRDRDIPSLIYKNRGTIRTPSEVKNREINNTLENHEVSNQNILSELSYPNSNMGQIYVRNNEICVSENSSEKGVTSDNQQNSDTVPLQIYSAKKSVSSQKDSVGLTHNNHIIPQLDPQVINLINPGSLHESSSLDMGHISQSTIPQ